MSDIYAKPGATFYSELDNATTGLVGTLQVQIIRKSDGAVVSARTTAGIAESPASSGRYVATLVAPASGDYTVLWDKGTVAPEQTAADDLVVTPSISAIVEPSGGTILSLAEYKTRRQLNEASPERDESIEAALVGAEDAVLQYTSRDFTTAEAIETRTFPWEIHSVILETDDFVGEPTSITFEVPGIGGAIVFPTNAYWLGPREGATFYYIDFTPAKGIASESIGAMGFTRNLDTYFARAGGGPDAVNAKVTANFGWPGAAPASVKQAVAWLADEFVAETPGGEQLEAESIENLSYTFQREPTKDRPPTLPPRVQQLLDPYRRIAL